MHNFSSSWDAYLIMILLWAWFGYTSCKDGLATQLLPREKLAYIIVWLIIVIIGSIVGWIVIALIDGIP
jgi:hypothetical protein